jgi:serine/threonine-protein kinase HipA
MKRTVTVCIGEAPRVVGTLYVDAQRGKETAAFAYDRTWLAAPDAFPIEPQLQLAEGSQFPAVLGEGSPFHGAIADTEPDGWGQRVIRRDHAKQREVARKARKAEPAPLGRLDYLLAVDDRSRVGALRFRDEQGSFQRTAPDGARTAPPLIELAHLLSATRAVEMSAETAADLEYLRGRGTSLGGMRPKCTVVDEDGALAIGKFPSVTDERSIPRGEVLALRLAKLAGIDAAEGRIVISGTAPVAVIRRFDRVGGRRLMYISAATLLGIDPHAADDHAYTDIVDALRTHGATPPSDIHELWRRIAFSILITNVDDHLRNHGFLHATKGQWRLSPAFDVNPVPDKTRELKTWISHETGPDATIDSLLSIASYCGLSLKQARTILREVDAAVAQWRRLGTEVGMTAADLDQYAGAFEHAERAAARTGR